ncbi:MAG: hypothetical protein ACHP7K_01890 [Actinomycetales bacterium]
MIQKLKTRTSRKPGDSLVGFGAIAGILGMFLALMTAGSAVSIGLTLSLTIGGLLLVIVGYLKRITVAIEARQDAAD